MGGRGKEFQEGGVGMTFNAHPRGVSRLFRVNDEIKLCSKSSNGGGMKSLSAPTSAVSSPSRNLKSSRVYSPPPRQGEKEENSPSLVAAGIKFEQKKEAEGEGIPPRWSLVGDGIKGGNKVVR